MDKLIKAKLEREKIILQQLKDDEMEDEYIDVLLTKERIQLLNELLNAGVN